VAHGSHAQSELRAPVVVARCTCENSGATLVFSNELRRPTLLEHTCESSDVTRRGSIVNRTFFLSVLLLTALTTRVGAATESTGGLERREWKVDGVTREALLHVPSKASSESTPVVFVFHGHGGNMNNAARMFGIHTRWRESIVVYPQGLNTPGRLTDPDGKAPGWQKSVGDQSDRDLKFFDAVLATLRKDYRVDSKRIYSTGHSNGGAFTYLLLAARGSVFAAVAPSAAAYLPALNPKAGTYSPRPIMHLGAENDPLVKFEWQKETMDTFRKLNQCGEGKSWMDEKDCTIYDSKANSPVITFIHSGRHSFPARGADLIVKFFKQNPNPP
jgi:polyhydroxybutyrate depolymerase